MKYKTQMEAAKHGFVTDEMKIVAEKEGVTEPSLTRRMNTLAQCAVQCAL